jgi:hypothetical protein
MHAMAGDAEAYAERMDERERAVALLLLRAGVRSHTHLHRLIEQAQPGLANVATIWRYLYKPPRKLDFRIVKAVAAALETDGDTLVAVLSGDRLTLE